MDNQLKARLLQAQKDREEWCERLNEEWREAEALFASMNVGRDVVVLFRSVGPEPGPWMNPTDHLLGFRKLERGWCVCYGVGPQGYEYWEHPWGWKRIAECSLQTRIEAAAGIPKLLDAIVAAAETVTGEVEEALATLNEAKTRFGG